MYRTTEYQIGYDIINNTYRTAESQKGYDINVSIFPKKGPTFFNF